MQVITLLSLILLFGTVFACDLDTAFSNNIGSTTANDFNPTSTANGGNQVGGIWGFYSYAGQAPTSVTFSTGLTLLNAFPEGFSGAPDASDAGYSASSAAFTNPSLFTYLGAGTSGFSGMTPGEVFGHPGQTSDLVIIFTAASTLSTSGAAVSISGSYVYQSGCGAGPSYSFQYAIVVVPSGGTANGITYTTVTNNVAPGSVSGSFTVPTSVTLSAGDQVWFIMDDAGNFNCNGGIIELTVTPTSASGLCDPIFNGFLGQQFSWGGQKEKEYHLFSDKYASLNTIFGDAMSSLYPESGTVMKGYDFRWSGGKLIWDVDSISEDATSFSFYSSQKKVTLDNNRSVNITECVRVSWVNQTVVIETPNHYLKFAKQFTSNPYINTTYWNFEMNVPLEKEVFGGILGGTASDYNFWPQEEEMVVLPMLIGKAQADVYRAIPFDCSSGKVSAGAIASSVAPSVALI